MTFGSSVWKKGSVYPHTLICIFKSNITMIAKVCDREIRRDSWFENRLVTKSDYYVTLAHLSFCAKMWLMYEMHVQY